MIEKKLELTLLFDFYGDLLTEKQQAVLNLHLYEDYGHVEIGETLDISRQAVYDTIKTCDRQLHEFEVKLGLIGRYHERQIKLERVLLRLKTLQDLTESNANAELLSSITKDIEEILAL